MWFSLGNAAVRALGRPFARRIGYTRYDFPLRATGRIFSVTKHYFARRIKDLAREVGFEVHARFGTHAFRRGMAQEIVDMGGSLATLMEAGGWTSSAFRVYLRGAQVEDMAVASAIIQLSDSETE